MSKISDFRQYRSGAFRVKLRSLYNEISSFSSRQEFSKRNLTEDEIEFRARFFRRIKGEFIRIFRLKCKMTPEAVANFIGLTVADLEQFEAGDLPLPDPQFFKLCELVRAHNEVSIFLERLEEALNPGLAKHRTDIAESLKAYGFKFADPEKYQSSDKGVIIRFPKQKDEDDSQ
jgi:transcriptional regulator with XRE-family HTH domain